MAKHTYIIRGPLQRRLAKACIDQAPLGYVVTVKEQTRTTPQNDKLWAMLSDVSRAKPNGRMATPEVWKELFMSAIGYETRFEMGLDGKPFPAGFSSSKLSVSEMRDLIEFIYAWCADKGVQWTEPKQKEAA